jgi:uncharacterized protein YqjF (DUF2071 family)
MLLVAEWRWLVMLNFAVDHAVLAPFVPRGTELDQWDGSACASVVGFLFSKTRVFGIPIPGYREFEELNLRFYVRRRGSEGWRRGVVFVKEVVPRQAIAGVARRLYNENYVALPMSHQVDLHAGGGASIEYRWRAGGRWATLGARVSGSPQTIADGSEEEFITEHYWGYVRQRDRGCVEYGVEHPRWRVWRPDVASLDADLDALYGPALAEALDTAPRSALVAEGSPVVVRHGVRLD